MRLTFVEPYKSITSFPEIELPNFVVLTGVNGGGKTHLIEAIEKGVIRIEDITYDNQTKPIRLFNSMNLIPSDNGAFAPSQLTQERLALWNEISGLIRHHSLPIMNVLQSFNKHDLMSKTIHNIINMTEGDMIATGSDLNQAQEIIQVIKQVATNVNYNVINHFTQHDRNRSTLVNSLEDKTKIPLIAFNEDNFYKNFPKGWISVDMFQQSFGRLFAEYQRNWLLNELKELAHSKGKSVTFLSEQEFRTQNGKAPWDFLNSILEKANLDFRINRPDEYSGYQLSEIQTYVLSR
jgi:hypothetical protein